VGLTAATTEGFQLYLLDNAPEGVPGTPRLLHQSDQATFGPTFSHGGEVAVLASTAQSGKMQFSLLAFDTATGTQLGELWDGPETSIGSGPFAPLAGDTRLLATTNRSGVTRPLLWNPRTGERIDLALGDLEGDVEPWDWSWDGRRVLLCQIHNAVQQLHMYDLQQRTVTRLEHPAGSFGGAYFTPQDEIFGHWQDSVHPSRLIALDSATGHQTRTVLVAGDVPPGHAWRSVSFPASDGQQIQGWLVVPDGEGPFPTILETHGGPTGVVTESFSPESQAWVDHGFAFVTVNYRGSTTFGRAFQDQIIGDLGHWEVEDMVAARDWLVREGIAQPAQIFLTGWSYGGYLTLQALGKRPDLWAGGMAGIAIADWAMQYEDSAEVLRGVIVAFFGGSPQEKPAQFAASSPITYAENVAAPVLIIQGRNDTRTPPRPVEAYAATLQTLNKPVEVQWFDSGHMGSFAQVNLSVIHLERMLRFATQIVGSPTPASV